MSTAQSNFRVLRGENQPRLEDLKISNTPELLQFAALTGEEVTIDLLGETQTAIVQHHVKIVMDCSSLIEAGGKLLRPVEWTRQSYFEDEDGALTPKGAEIVIYPGSGNERLRAEGELNRFLNIARSNIRTGAERADNGLYTCTVCMENGCRTSSVMLFLIGAPPRLDFVADNGEFTSLLVMERRGRERAGGREAGGRVRGREKGRERDRGGRETERGSSFILLPISLQLLLRRAVCLTSTKSIVLEQISVWSVTPVTTSS